MPVHANTWIQSAQLFISEIHTCNKYIPPQINPKAFKFDHIYHLSSLMYVENVIIPLRGFQE